MKKILILISILFSLNASSQVWDSRENWTLEWEEEYRQWVKTSFHKNIYNTGELKNLLTDCADAVYGARIYFSYLNNLPFKVKNPYGSNDQNKKFLSNESMYFNKYKSGEKRLRAFIDYITDHFGTYQLAFADSFPLLPSEIRPGDLYVTQWKSNSGSNIRHSYIIKDLLSKGSLLLYYSTTPKKVRNLIVRKGMPIVPPPGKPFGFKRFRWPEFVGLPVNMIPASLGHSNRQYHILKSEGKRRYFSNMRSEIFEGHVELETLLTEKIENICENIEFRVTVVDDALAYKSRIGRCLNENEYDEYSTPSRDMKINKELNELIELWRSEGRYYRGRNKSLRRGLTYLVENATGRRANKYINRLCSVDIGMNERFNLRDFMVKYNNGLLSSNPNAPKTARWGIQAHNPTCPEY